MIEQGNDTMIRELAAHLRALHADDAMQLDADDLAALAEGRVDAARRDALLAVLAESPADADLVKMLRELAPDSERLASAARGERGHSRGHRRVAAGASHRHHVPRRRAAFGFAGAGIAAALVCALAVVGWQQLASTNTASQPTAAVAAPDTVGDGIFHAPMDGARTADNDAPADQIFHAGMQGDAIFQASFKRG